MSTAAATAVSANGITAVAVIPSATFTIEAMPAPAVAVAPARPGTHAQKDAVVEVSRPIEAHGRAFVRRIIVVAVGADGLHADIDHDLCVRRRRQGQACKQCCSEN
jgi:hypothetical protein